MPPSLSALVCRSAWFWFGLAFVLMGAFIFDLGVQETLQEQQYEQEGVVVRAVVVNKSIQRATREKHPRTQYEVTYRFATQDGLMTERTAEVGVEEWERLEADDSVQVTYLPRAPELSRLAGKSNLIPAFAGLGFGGLMMLIGGGLSYRSVSRIRRELRLRREGMLAEGIVLRVELSGVRVNGVPQWQLRYGYHDHLGQLREGCSDWFSPEEAAQWPEGAKGTVRFDRQRPEDSLWVGK